MRRIVLEKGIERGFQNLQNIYASKSQKHVGDDTPAQTKLDRSLAATNDLFATASRLEDANTILQVCLGRTAIERGGTCLPPPSHGLL